jgi:hypothetical protein
MAETNGQSRPVNLPGIYKHKETGVTVEIQDAHGLGNQQADAFVQTGFVRVEAEAPQAETKQTKEKEGK